MTWEGCLRGARLRLAAACLCLLPAGQGIGQEPSLSFLYINQERLLTDSVGGKKLLSEEEKARNELVAEARRIDASFEAQELELTESRAELEPDAFRELAEDFDERVVAARAGQDERSDALAKKIDRGRRQFYARIAPLLVEVMDSYGALAIFADDSILLAHQSINITDRVIDMIDAVEQAEGGGDAPPGGDDEQAVETEK